MKRWYNNGSEEHLVDDKIQLEGFVRGRLPYKESAKLKYQQTLNNKSSNKIEETNYRRSVSQTGKCKTINKESRRQTIISKYGSWDAYKQHLKEQTQATLVKKYGSLENAYQQQNETRKQTFAELYNGNPFANDSIKEKIKQTNRANFGTDYPMQNKEIVSKSVQNHDYKKGVETARSNNLKKYGETMLAEGIAELTELRSSLTANSQLVYPID